MQYTKRYWSIIKDNLGGSCQSNMYYMDEKMHSLVFFGWWYHNHELLYKTGHSDRQPV